MYNMSNAIQNTEVCLVTINYKLGIYYIECNSIQMQ